VIIRCDYEEEAVKKAIHFLLKRYEMKRGSLNLLFSVRDSLREFYMKASKLDISWLNINIYLLDENYSLLESERSNYEKLKSWLLDETEVPRGNIHHIKKESTFEDSKAKYEKEIELFREEKSFDLVILYVDKDGNYSEENFKIEVDLEIINNSTRKIFIQNSETKEVIEEIYYKEKHEASKITGDRIFLLSK